MNHKSNISDAERQLLGPAEAVELARDLAWLAGQPVAPPMPAGLNDRVVAAVNRELDQAAAPRRRTRSWQWLQAVAAILALAVLVGLFADHLGRRPMDQPSETLVIETGPRLMAADAEAVAAAEEAIDQFLAPIDPLGVQLHFAMKDLEAPPANPWESLASAIEER